ncbi:lysosomal amino acid transporter 1-like isoform X2 [Ptychodera flava]|uniref:lysosomal amino acid transporter 1-like isoform X2 n=1 Tax=Ptychodera flava TaxID=63121 RepID=UPI00396A9943
MIMHGRNFVDSGISRVLRETMEHTDFNSATDNCSQPIQKYFHQCVETSVQYAGFYTGIISVFIWLMAHIILFRIRQSDANTSAKSFLYLVHMTVADICNLMGAIYTKQLGSQIFTAGYFIFMDAVFFLQYFCVKCGCYNRYFNTCKDSCATSLWKRKRRQQSEQVYCFIIPWIVSGIYLSNTIFQDYSMGNQRVLKTGRVLLSLPEGENVKIGYVLGAIAAMFYWLSRLPTICEIYAASTIPTWSRIFFHLLCMVGGVTYSVAVVTQSLALDFVLNALPWLLGLLCLAGLDLGIAIQMIVNRTTDNKNTVSNVMSLLRDDDDTESGAGVEEVNAEWIAVKPMSSKYLKKSRKSENFEMEELETLRKKTRDKKTGLLIDISHDDGYVAEREDSEDDETVLLQVDREPSDVEPRVMVTDYVYNSDSTDKSQDNTDLEWEDFQSAPATLTVHSTTHDTKKWSSDEVQMPDFGSSTTEAEKKSFEEEWRSRPEADWDF